MLKIEKIEDKSLNLDVQGQGCWSDCYIGAHWEEKADFNTYGCEWHTPKETEKSWFLW